VIRKMILTALAVLVAAGVLLAGPGTAGAAGHPGLLPVKSGVPRRLAAFDWAMSQRGCWYVWGGTGPCADGYDCSGLVMMAYRHAGVDLPRTTGEMLASPLLVRVYHPRKGDLAFFGSGHVELFDRPGYTLGAHDSGSPVSVIHYGWGWYPTEFFRVR